MPVNNLHPLNWFEQRSEVYVGIGLLFSKTPIPQEKL